MSTWRVTDPYGYVLTRAQIARATGDEPPPGFDWAAGLTWEQADRLTLWLRERSMAYTCRAEQQLDAAPTNC